MLKLSKKKQDMELETENENEELDADTFTNSLQKLKSTDPEFYKFLEENDRKLLDFAVESDSDDKSEIHSESDDEIVHKPNTNLQEDSEESDFEDNDQNLSTKKLTIKIINQWQNILQSDGKIELSTISNVVKAFHAALIQVSNNENKSDSYFIIEGSGTFNAVIQMCVLYLQPSLKKVLGLKKSDKNPQKCKKWVKVKGLLKTYFLDLIKLLGNVTSTNILNILLKHLHQMSLFLGCFPTIAKVLFKRLVSLWSNSEETIQVLAFLCILRVTSNNRALLLDNVLKMMYMTYVKNSKFVSPSTMPGISFMRRSLIEMLALDVNVSYQHVFLYIRQLAIHLRNAVVIHKKENIQIVYNWQYINSLQLWSEFLAATKTKLQLQTLMYPLVMIITNTIKLNPTAQYYPLRFHCVKILINLSRDADVYIPLLPFLLEVLASHDFSKKHKKVSMKPMDFSCVLRLSKSHLTENGCKDAIIENIYILMIETLSLYSHSISFPDITVPCQLQLKQFLKKCTIGNYSKKIRIIIDKIEENSKYIKSEQKKITFQLQDVGSLKGWENNIQNAGTPLQKYHDDLKKVYHLKIKTERSKNNDAIDNLPIIKKTKRSVERNSEKLELFPSDSENDSEFIEPPKKIMKKSKVKRTEKISVAFENAIEDKFDELQDLNLKDW